MIPSNRIKAEYDRIAPFFSVGSALTFPFRRSLYERNVIPRLHLSRGASALELCCGVGHNFQYILDAIGPEGTLIGIDFSEKMLAKAQARVDRNGWKNVKLIWGDAMNLDELIAQPLDLILCSLALSLISDRMGVLQAIRNRLKSNGRLAVIEAQPFSGIASLLNPVLYVSMLPVPSNNSAIFREASRTLECIKQVFPHFEYSEHYWGFMYVVVTQTMAGS